MAKINISEILRISFLRTKQYIDEKIDNINTILLGKADKNHGTHLDLGTGSGNAFRGDYGNTAYQHSQAAHAPSNAQKNSDITKAEIEAKLTGTITSHSHSSVSGNAGSANKVNNAVKVQLNGGTTEGTNQFTFDGSAAKTINITASSIGAAGSSHGTHVTWATNAPSANGTASTGSVARVAREDHVHPLQTSVSGNAGTATKLQTTRNITIGNKTNSFDGSAAISYTLSDIGAAPTSHSAHTAYGTCATAASTAEKVVVIADTNWKLEVGNMISVKFSANNSASNVTINVNNTGAYPIWYNNSQYTGSNASYAGYKDRSITYMFNGTHWVWIAAGYLVSYSNASLGQGYGTCTTAEATTAKVVTLANYSLQNGGMVTVKFTNAVPANATLNVNSKGAKNIHFRGAAITAGIIEAGDTATFMYDNVQYQLVSIDRWQTDLTTFRAQVNDALNEKASVNVVTTATNGLMSATDKSKLDSYTLATDAEISALINSLN